MESTGDSGVWSLESGDTGIPLLLSVRYWVVFPQLLGPGTGTARVVVLPVPVLEPVPVLASGTTVQGVASTETTGIVWQLVACHAL